MLNVKEKIEIREKFGSTENDTGSTEVQIAMLTERINMLMTHFRMHKHDTNAKRGFFKMIGQRKKFLRYLNKKNPEKYQWIIKELGIRK